MKIKRFVFLTSICLFILLLFCSLALNAVLYLQINGLFGWRNELRAQVSMVASTQALSDFQNGTLRLYAFDGTAGDEQPTGNKEGSFDIWRPSFAPETGPVWRFSTEQYTESYNRKMRYMITHPDEFPPPEDIVIPPEESGNLQETGSGDFATFLLERLAEMGVSKTLTREFGFPEATWNYEPTLEGEPEGFTVEISGWSFSQVSSFLGALFGTPFANSTLSDGSSSAMVRDETLLIQFSETDDGGVRLIGTK